jgi:phage shock protein C
MKRYQQLFSSDRRLYRSRKGVILGVCRGLSNYFNLRVAWVRVLTVAVLLVSGIWPIVVVYLIAGMLMKPEPMIPFETEEQKDFYDGYTANRHRTLRDLKRRFTNLDRRLRRMEDTVTSRDFEWEQRMNR